MRDLAQGDTQMQLDRRGALFGLAAAGAAIPLMITQAKAQTQTAAGGGSDNYVLQTLTVGTLALRTSEIALQKATDPNVRKFAELEAAEQKAVASVLAATPAGQKPPELGPEQQKKIDDLNGTQQGPDFDQAYLQGQIEGHNQLLQIQQTKSGEREPTVEAITARLAEQGISSHLVMLNLIQQMLGAENIQNIQEGKNPDGSTTPRPGNGDGGTDQGGGNGQGGQQPAPADGTPPANNGG